MRHGDWGRTHFVFSGSVHADSGAILAHYADVLAAVSHGGSLQAVSMLGNCVPAAGDSIKFGSAQFNHFFVYPAEKRGQQIEAVGTSTAILVNKKNAGFVLEHIRLRILSDDSAEFTLQYLNPANYSVVLPGSSYQCRLNANQNWSGGITLYGRNGGGHMERESDSKSGQ